MGLDMTSDIRQMMDALDDEQARIEKAVHKAVEEFTWSIYRIAQQRTPVDTGFLRQSARVREVDFASFKIIYLASYAIYVHDREELDHDVGQALFLESAINESRFDARQKLAVLIERYR